MRYELWGRSRETKVYEFIDSFEDEVQKFYMMDQVDQDVYYEAMILRTDWQQIPVCIMYQEFPKHTLEKRRL